MNDHVRESALRLIAQREYTSHDLHQKLTSKFPGSGPAIAEVMQEFQKKNWISDERFCENYIENKVLNGSLGPFQITQKLKLKGIDESLVKAHLEKHFPAEDQATTARTLAEKKHREILSRGKNEPHQAVQQKVMRYLVGKGYSFDVAKRVVEDL
jgi:regulatory protein